MVTKEEIEKKLKEVMDPELMMDVMTLELIYKVSVTKNKVHVLMTFTTPLCPYGPQLQKEIKEKLLELDGIDKVETEVTFTPRWEPSEELRAMFGL